MQKFEILSREKILDEKFCEIEKQIVRLPNGETAEWFLKLNADAAVIVPQMRSGEILLQKTYKHGAAEFIVEFCAGLVDAGETPAAAAVRELAEETGCVAEKISKIGEVFVGPTSTPMKYHFFFAENCTQKNLQNLEKTEQIETFLVKNLKSAAEILLDPKTKTATSDVTALKFAENFLAKKLIFEK